MGLNRNLGNIPQVITELNGNIGINTTTPSAAKLHVKGENGSAIAYLYNNSGTSGQVNGLAVEAGTNSSDYALSIGSSLGTSYLRVRGDGNVGIGTSSLELKMNIVGEGGAFPATGGTSQTGALRLEQEGSNICADFGSNGPSGVWLQVTNKTNLAQIFPLLLNPNGGNVLIGTQTDNGNKLQVNGGITAVGLVLSGNHNITVVTNSGWSSYQNIINPGILQTNATFLISVQWYYTGAENQPYFCNCSFLFMGSYTNGGGVDNEFTPLCSTHTGNTGANISFRVIAGTGGSTSGIQARLNNFATRSGVLTVRATRLD